MSNTRLYLSSGALERERDWAGDKILENLEVPLKQTTLKVTFRFHVEWDRVLQRKVCLKTTQCNSCAYLDQDRSAMERQWRVSSRERTMRREFPIPKHSTTNNPNPLSILDQLWATLIIPAPTLTPVPHPLPFLPLTPPSLTIPCGNVHTNLDPASHTSVR